MMKIVIFGCDILTPISATETFFLKNAGVAVCDGKILEIGPLKKINTKYQNVTSKYIDREGHIAMPTFFDMHFHWVQDEVSLMPKESLLEWLTKYTWPSEAKFKNVKYSQKKAKEFSEKLLANGILGGAVYASIHEHTVDHAIKYFKGDFIVGNVLMDMNSPDYLLQKSKLALKSVQKLSEKYKGNYAVTPRFAITTTPKLMRESAKLSKKYKTFIQTHLSETKNEIEYVLSIYKKFNEFKNIKDYTSIYEKCDILGPKTIMGHGIYLNSKELKLLKKTNTVLCHCPTSNAPINELGLGSGLFNFKEVEKNKIKWALGTDIGGGPYLSMFDVIKSFVNQNHKKKIKEATFSKGLYHATLAGAEILRLEKECGSLEKNKWANLIFVKSPSSISQKNNGEVVLKKIINSKKQRNEFSELIFETYFRGELVYSKLR
jgi:guanine deaminase